MKKIIFTIFILLFSFIPVYIKAVSSSEVDYTLEKYYISSEIEIAGGVKTKKFIEMDGTFNGYLYIKNIKNLNVDKFTGKPSDLKGSSIYDSTSLSNIKVGILKTYEADLNMLIRGNFEDKIEYFKQKDYPQNGDKGVYSIEISNDGVYSIKIYNETINSKTIFYIEYVETNVIVEHNDSAEFYYSFISGDYQDAVKDMKIFVSLPWASENLFKVWAHGQLNASVQRDSEKRYVIAEIQNYEVGKGVDIRILFDKDLFPININESKKSGMDALPIIEDIEEQRADEANSYRRMQATYYYGMYVIDFLYIGLIIFLFVYVYIKHDKEYKSSFKSQYYREFIEDYNVEDIDYLMKKKITPDAFSSSILNLIYKKNIEIEEITMKRNKKDYKFIYKNEEKLNNAEKIIINLLFNEIGNNKEVLLSEIKSISKKTSSSGKNIIYDEYNKWKKSVEIDAVSQNFYVDNHKVKLIFSLFGIAGIFLFILNSRILGSSLGSIILALSIIFILYIWTFNKRTVKGNEDYNKWKAFKNFLNDFGRLKEKELPEIKLWERYLVYATILGVADKLRKTMKFKFEEINPNYTMRNSMFDYYIFTNITHDITRGVISSLNTATSSVNSYKAHNASSGSGMGGGFSSGGGFGGGGGSSGGGF